MMLVTMMNLLLLLQDTALATLNPAGLRCWKLASQGVKCRGSFGTKVLESSFLSWQLQLLWQTFSDSGVILTHFYSFWIEFYIQFWGRWGSDSWCFLLAWFERLRIPHLHMEKLGALSLHDWWQQISLGVAVAMCQGHGARSKWGSYCPFKVFQDSSLSSTLPGFLSWSTTPQCLM